MSVVAHKNYLADKKPFFKHVYPRDITITAVRSVAMQGLMVFNGFVASLELEEESETESEEDDEDGKHANAIDQLTKKAKKAIDDKKKDEFVAPTTQEFATACATSFTKSLSISTCLRSLEEVAILCLRPQLVGKLVKDVSKSAVRKYARTQSRFAAAAMLVKTGMRSNLLGHLAIFIIEETHQVLLILYRRFSASNDKDAVTKKTKSLRSEDDKEGDADEQAPPSFLTLTIKNARRSSLAVVTGGVGAAVGTILRPGLGTVIGATLGDTIAYVM